MLHRPLIVAGTATFHPIMAGPMLSDDVEMLNDYYYYCHHYFEIITFRENLLCSYHWFLV